MRLLRLSPQSLDEGALRERLLNSGRRANRYWKEFLNRYSRLILKVAWQFERDHDAVMDKYLFVCTRLADDDFAVLREYDAPDRTDGRQARFSTWLTVVVRNLCVEEHRRREGRKRYPEALEDASDLVRRVFALFYWEGVSRREATLILSADGRFSEQDVVEALDAIEQMGLRPSRTWKREQAGPRVSLEEYDPVAGNRDVEVFEDQSAVEQLVRSLDREERVVVRLRFWGGLTAGEIGNLTGLDRRRIYTILTAATRRMKQAARTQNAS